MKNMFLLSLVAASLLLCGCPYESSIPLDKPSIPVDRRLMGTWTSKSAPEKYNVKARNDKEYEITELDSSGATERAFTGYLSTAGKVPILTLQEETDEGMKFTFFRITIKSNAVSLAPVSDNLKETFATSFELKAFFEKNAGKSTFYDKDTLLLQK